MRKNLFHCESDQTPLEHEQKETHLEQPAKRGSGVSIFGGTQNWTGQGSEQQTLADLPLSSVLD